MIAKLTLCWLTWTCWFPPPSPNCSAKVYLCSERGLTLPARPGRESLE